MDSTPPVRQMSAQPATILDAPVASVCTPEEQKRFIVIAGTSTGMPARRAALRATFSPCSPSGIAQPMMMSSMVLGSSSGIRSRNAFINNPSRSSGRVCRRVPLIALPTAVR